MLLWLVIALAPWGATASEKALGLEAVRDEGIRRSGLRARKTASVDSTVPKAGIDQFREAVEPILVKHCVPCHGPEKSKARLRIDTLDPDLLNGSDVDWWLEVSAVLGNGEMPPPEEPSLSGQDRARVLEWLSGEIHIASKNRRATAGHTSFRRMTRDEYNYALQDLLGLPWQFSRDLPPEAYSEDGFQNSSETLQMSVSQLESYRRLARKALLRAIASGPEPPVSYWGVSMERASAIEWRKQEAELEKRRRELKDDAEQLEIKTRELMATYHKTHSTTYFKDTVSGRTARHTWSYGGARYALAPEGERPQPAETSKTVAVLPKGRNLLIELGDKVPDEGILRVRVRAARADETEGKSPSLQLEFGWQASNEGRARLQVSKQDHLITASLASPEFYQWEIPLGDIYPRNSVRKVSKLGSMPNPSEYIRLVNSAVSGGDVIIDYVEVAAPVYKEWPPRSHQQLFLGRKRGMDEVEHAREILSSFMKRAWRRPVSEIELRQKQTLFEVIRPTCDSFEEAIVETLATILSSPDFLYVGQSSPFSPEDSNSGDARLNNYELASRLAIFLWSSLPDERLLATAETGKLGRPEVLLDEVRRMLQDPRTERFAKHFVEGWLGMQGVDFLKTGRGFDQPLKAAMQQEPVAVFREMLRHDESVLNFLHNDYTMANERLAQHYGLSKVQGNAFRKVRLEPKHHRGGVLTQSGFLAMNSSGDDSNPLKRGIWVLERLLNDPPPPPPPVVPEIDLADPEIAKMTLKEQLADHRDQDACRSCHAKIDPWGIAFENFDALGRWRDTIDGKPVDAASQLFNNERLNGIDGLKRFLLKNRQDQFVLALVNKMTVYALGRPLTFADQAAIEEMAVEVRRKGDGLATLVQRVATSPLFLTK